MNISLAFSNARCPASMVSIYACKSSCTRNLYKNSMTACTLSHPLFSSPVATITPLDVTRTTHTHTHTHTHKPHAFTRLTHTTRPPSYASKQSIPHLLTSLKMCESDLRLCTLRDMTSICSPRISSDSAHARAVRSLSGWMPSTRASYSDI